MSNAKPEYYIPAGYNSVGVLPGSAAGVSAHHLPGADPAMRQDSGGFGFREYSDATDVQVTEAALAGWRVAFRSDRIYPWTACSPDGRHVSIFLTEREAWAACWHCMQAALEQRGEVY